MATAQVIPFPSRPSNVIDLAAAAIQRVFYRGQPYAVQQVYETRALISGPILPGIEPRERIARIDYLAPLPPANHPT
jgi:hypothetical protein